MAEGNPTTSKEELARLHADYDAHYVKALEELEIRKRTRVHDHIVDMVSVSMSSPTFPPVFVPSSSVRARVTDVGYSYCVCDMTSKSMSFYLGMVHILTFLYCRATSVHVLMTGTSSFQQIFKLQFSFFLNA